MSESEHAETSAAVHARSPSAWPSSRQSRREAFRERLRAFSSRRRRARARLRRGHGRLRARYRTARRRGDRRRRMHPRWSPSGASRRRRSQCRVSRGRRHAPSVPQEGSFDIAAAVRTLHHVPRPEVVVAELVTRRRTIAVSSLIIDQIAPTDPLARLRARQLRTGERPVAHAAAAGRRHPLAPRCERPRAPSLRAASGRPRRRGIPRSRGLRGGSAGTGSRPRARRLHGDDRLVPRIQAVARLALTSQRLGSRGARRQRHTTRRARSRSRRERPAGPDRHGRGVRRPGGDGPRGRRGRRIAVGRVSSTSRTSTRT